MSVTSTSGTVIPLDANHAPLHAALMYDDSRSATQAVACQAAARRANPHADSFGTSFGLPKILWYRDNYPEQSEKISVWSHAADYIIGQLSGVWGVTDPTSALKTGYDPAQENWPAFVIDDLGIPASWLPRVVPSASPVGTLRPSVAQETGLPPSLVVTTGMTDGCASQIASGSVKPGEWSSTIGTTLVIKGVTHRQVVDPGGRIYNHRHPDGWWMPGGASNTGAAWIARDFAGANLESLDMAARDLIPTPWAAYPLAQIGERFPFIAPSAIGFVPENLTEIERFTANLEGVAYLERMAFDLIEKLSGERVEHISTAGGGSRGQTWLTIRANVLDRPIVRMQHSDAAFGAGILAAAARFDSVADAALAMTRPAQVVEPGQFVDAYQFGFTQFVQELERRGYVAPEGATV